MSSTKRLVTLQTIVEFDQTYKEVKLYENKMDEEQIPPTAGRGVYIPLFFDAHTQRRGVPLASRIIRIMPLTAKPDPRSILQNENKHHRPGPAGPR